MMATSTRTAPRKPRAGAATASRKPTARARATNQPAILANVDGRSLIARRFYDVCQAIIADQAGLARCSEARLQLIRRFAAAAVMAESMESRLASGEAIDVAEHALHCSTLVRLASRIGINRVAKNVTPTLEQYLGQQQEEP